MQQRTLGKTGMTVSVLGFGGAEIGFEKTDIAAVGSLLHAALDAGLNVLDTAECYSAGSDETSSEFLIGETVAHRRSEYLLFTKCGHASGIDAPDWSQGLLRESIDRSLLRLRTDCVDLLQLHSCGADVLRQGDAIAVLQAARDAGKTRFIGYSGDGDGALCALETGAFDTLQTSVNIADQDCVTKTLPLAVQQNIGVIAKRPLANAAWRWRTEAEAWDYHKEYWRRLQILAYPFLSGDPDTVARTALQFALSVPGVATAIVGTKNPDRWARNAALLDGGQCFPRAGSRHYGRGSFLSRMPHGRRKGKGYGILKSERKTDDTDCSRRETIALSVDLRGVPTARTDWLFFRRFALRTDRRRPLTDGTTGSVSRRQCQPCQ